MALVSRSIRLQIRAARCARRGRSPIRESFSSESVVAWSSKGARYGLTAGHKIHRRYQLGFLQRGRVAADMVHSLRLDHSKTASKAGSLAAKCLAEFKSTQAKFFPGTIFSRWNAYERENCLRMLLPYGKIVGRNGKPSKRVLVSA